MCCMCFNVILKKLIIFILHCLTKLTFWCVNVIFHGLEFIYIYDIISDIILIVNLWLNCHVLFVAISILWFVISSCLTVCLLSYFLKQEFTYSMCYSYICLKHALIGVWYGDDYLSAEEKLLIHHIKFMECILESFPQLCLSFYIYHHHGLDENFWFFKVSDANFDFIANVKNQKLKMVKADWHFSRFSSNF